MNELEKIAAKRKLASLLKEAKIPGWAKPFAAQEGSVIRVTKWPKSKRLKAKLNMLQHGRANAPLHRKGGSHPTFAGKPGSGKPEGGWPEGSMMGKWRRQAGRSAPKTKADLMGSASRWGDESNKSGFSDADGQVSAGALASAVRSALRRGEFNMVSILD